MKAEPFATYRVTIALEHGSTDLARDTLIDFLEDEDVEALVQEAIERAMKRLPESLRDVIDVSVEEETA